jgi:eukaryotic-like serine/threonine-protein kinase
VRVGSPGRLDSVEIGKRLAPTLELVQEIGRGAMGSVWEARNTALGTTVAVKLLRPDTVFTADGEARFEREIEVLASLDHPHLVRIIDRGKTDEGAPFFVMEFLRGEDLGARLAREGALSVDDTVTIVTQACKGLAVAHARGVVHRDLKPANLFLLDDGGAPFAKVLDFGIAKRATELGMTSTGISVGTPFFMSPEQFFRPSKADHRTDLWALGVIAYVCLSGVLPFVGETPSAIGLAAMQDGFTPITRLRPDLREGWDEFFARALAPEPAQRFQSAPELAQALLVAAGLASGSTGVSTGALSTGALASRPAPVGAALEALALAPTAQVEPIAPEDAKLVASVGRDDLRSSAAPPREVAAVTSVSGRSVDGTVSASRWRAWGLGAVVFVAVGLGALVVARPWASAPSTTRGLGPDLPTAEAAPPSADPHAPSPPAPIPRDAASVVPSSAPSAPAPSASASASAAPRMAAPASAGPAAPVRLFPLGVVLECWRGNEGALATTPGSGAKVEIDLTAAGKVEAIRVFVPGNRFPGFRGCVVTKLSQASYGPGRRETLFSAVGLAPGVGGGASPPP